MSDYREQLEQERSRHRMPDDSYRRLEQRRDRKRRNRMITSGVLALVIAAAGGTGVVLAFRNAGTAPRPGGSPTGGSTAVPSPSATVVSPNHSAGLGAPGVPVAGAIQFIDADHGWFVSPNGQIMAQSGGSSPIVLYPGPKKVTAIQFVDADHGWALTADGLLRTSDGGAHWTFLDGPSAPLDTFQFVSDTTGVGISPTQPGTSGPGHLMRTVDAGQTWTEVATPDLVESMCWVPGTSTGWTAAGPTVYRTTDDGSTWQSTPLDVPAAEVNADTIRCDGEHDAWVLYLQGPAAGTSYHVVFHTSDGVTWKPVLQNGGLDPGNPRPGVYASNESYPGPLTVTGPNSLAFVGWCPNCGNSVDLLRTSDGGKTWDRIQVAAPDKGGEPQGASFVDADHGWILLTVRTDKGPAPAVAKVIGSTVTISSQQTVP